MTQAPVSVADRVRSAFSGQGALFGDPVFSGGVASAASDASAPSAPPPASATLGWVGAERARPVRADATPGRPRQAAGRDAGPYGGPYGGLRDLLLARDRKTDLESHPLARVSPSPESVPSAPRGLLSGGPTADSGQAAAGRGLAARWSISVGRPMLATELLRHLPSAPPACAVAGVAPPAGLSDGTPDPEPELYDAPAGASKASAGASKAASEASKAADEFVKAAYSRQSESFLAARSAYREFLGEELSEQAFLRRDVFEYRDDETPAAFRSRIEDAILAGRPYSAKMGARLQSVYSRAFGEPLHPDDREYGARIARDARAAVSGDAAVAISARLHEELACLEARATRVFLDVLGREPDAKELRAEVPALRALVPPEYYSDTHWDEKNGEAEAEGAMGSEGQMGSEGPSGRGGGLWRLLAPAAESLRVRLHRSLEFHEVLKREIAARAAAASGRAPSNREIFGALSAVVAGCAGRPETLTEAGNPAAPGAVWLVDWDAALRA